MVGCDSIYLKYPGNLFSYNMLDEEYVYVFDFGSEFYIWNGRNSPNSHKKAGIKLARQLFTSGYDYSHFSISPLNGKLKDDNFETDYLNNTRPKWTLFGKQTQNAETILFRSKFIDWPVQNCTPSLKKIGYNGSLKKVEAINQVQSPIKTQKKIFNFEPLSEREVLELTECKETIVNLVLELTNLGRGRYWFDQEENRKFDIITENVQIWKISNNELLYCGNFTELVSNYSYVVKWHYRVNAVGFKTLKGNASQYSAPRGRDRYALFFWQGKNSSYSEKGCSALLSLDNLAASVGSNPTNSETKNLFGIYNYFINNFKNFSSNPI